MKKIVLACLVPIFSLYSICSALGQSSDIEIKIHQAQQRIDAQMEKIKLAREQADTEMTLAKMRIGEQLRRSQEDLARQMETLERLKEKLAEQKVGTESAIQAIRSNWSGMNKAFTDVESGIQNTNSLLSKMQNVRDDLGDGSTKNNAAPCNSGKNNIAQAAADNNGQVPVQNTEPSPKPAAPGG